MDYRKEIDGIRALCIFSVILFHSVFKSNEIGFISVDIFFLLSGYLITSKIEDGLSKGNFSVSHYFIKRLRRIAPVYYVMLIVTMFAFYPILPTNIYYKTIEAAQSAIFFISNIHFHTSINYFFPVSYANPFLHSWSISVEEQFYLICPFLLIGLAKLKRLTSTTIILLTIFLTFLANIYAFHFEPHLSFYLLPFRLWEFLLGILLAKIIKQNSGFTLISKKLGEFISFICLIFLVYVLFFSKHHIPFYIMTMLSLLATSLIIFLSTHTKTITSKILSNKFLTHFGLISYSLYLWHWPVQDFASSIQMEVLTSTQQLLVFACTYLISLCSYKFIEVPTRFKTTLFTNKTILAISALGLISSFIVSNLVRPHEYINDFHYTRSDLADKCDDKGDAQNCIIKEGTGKKIILAGDSHAMSILPGFFEAIKETDIQLYFSYHAGCPFIRKTRIENRSLELLKNCHQDNQNTVNFANENKIDEVYIITNFPNYFLDVIHNRDELILDFTESLDAFTHSKVKLLISNPLFTRDPSSHALKAQKLKKDPQLSFLLMDYLKKDASAYAPLKDINYAQFNFYDILCPKGTCQSVINDQIIYSDSEHINVLGALLLAKKIKEIILL